MNEHTGVENCRWARPTIRLPYPYWVEAEDTPWSCLHDQEPFPLENTDTCKGCPRWEPKHLPITKAARA